MSVVLEYLVADKENPNKAECICIPRPVALTFWLPHSKYNFCNRCCVSFLSQGNITAFAGVGLYVRQLVGAGRLRQSVRLIVFGWVCTADV